MSSDDGESPEPNPFAPPSLAKRREPGTARPAPSGMPAAPPPSGYEAVLPPAAAPEHRRSTAAAAPPYGQPASGQQAYGQPAPGQQPAYGQQPHSSPPTAQAGRPTGSPYRRPRSRPTAPPPYGARRTGPASLAPGPGSAAYGPYAYGRRRRRTASPSRRSSRAPSGSTVFAGIPCPVGLGLGIAALRRIKKYGRGGPRPGDRGHRRGGHRHRCCSLAIVGFIVFAIAFAANHPDDPDFQWDVDDVAARPRRWSRGSTSVSDPPRPPTPRPTTPRAGSSPAPAPTASRSPRWSRACSRSARSRSSSVSSGCTARRRAARAGAVSRSPASSSASSPRSAGSSSSSSLVVTFVQTRPAAGRRERAAQRARRASSSSATAWRRCPRTGRSTPCEVVPCAQAHEARVSSEYDFADDAVWPGQDGADARVARACVLTERGAVARARRS